MTGASMRGGRPARSFLPVLLTMLLLAIALSTGCRRQLMQAMHPVDTDRSRVNLLAYLDGNMPCQQATIDLLRDLEADRPMHLDVTIVDISTREGWERWQDAGLDAVALEIDGSTTVSWGEGDDRRTVTFEHPAGFAWTHNDLRDAIEAALAGGLTPADPAEAEGVRLMDVTVRGQSIRVGGNGSETGQLIIGDEIVIEIHHPRDELAPGQRVSAAAEALRAVLEQPFTPNQLTIRSQQHSVALMAAGQQLLLATEADLSEDQQDLQALAEQWRRSLREALVNAALDRPPASESPPPDTAPEGPAGQLGEALTPGE